LAPKSIYNSLCGAPENVPCITVPSDHSHWTLTETVLQVL
jgi:hypothetical protein